MLNKYVRAAVTCVAFGAALWLVTWFVGDTWREAHTCMFAGFAYAEMAHATFGGTR